MLLWPLPWEHTQLFQKPKQTKRKESFNSVLAPSASPSKSSSIPQGCCRHSCIVGCPPSTPEAPQDPAACSALLHDSHCGWKTLVGTRQDPGGAEATNKPHFQKDIWDSQGLAASGRSKLRCRVRSSLKTSPTLCHLARKGFFKFLPQMMSSGRAYVMALVPCCTCSLA